MFALLYGLLSAQLALSLELAGNEGYAYAARQSLAQQSSAHKRSVTSGLAFQPASVSFAIGDKQYLSPTGPQFRRHVAEAEWGLDAFAGQSLPVTVFDVEGEVTCDVLGRKLDKFQQADDVWDSSFLSGIFLTTSSAYHVSSDVSGCLEGWGGALIVKSGNATSDVDGVSVAKVHSVSGPYLAHINGNITLTQVYRSYRDEAQAFTAGTIHTEDNTFIDLSTPVSALNALSISVPSRLYTMDLPNARPLEGKRIAVKDLFDMAGLRTGGGNRAYYNTYPAKNVTAVAIQRLVDQGGIIVGRVKTSQFANGEDATADWVDQMCPFNPRGDGYQQPASSSSGPGAAAGAYEWLDHTIGSDTGGSIIDPASVQGVYGLRPSWTAISLEGAIPLQATQDTAGFFARNAQAGLDFARGWYGDRFGNYTALPANLILPNSSWDFDADFAGAEQFNAFRDGLLNLVQPASVDVRDFEGYWNSSGRFEQVNATASDYLYEVYANLITYYQWNNFGKLWFEDYAEQNDGRQPFVDPSPLVRWTYARDNLTEADFNSSTAKKALFKDFVDTEVLVKDNRTCSSAIYVAPYGLAQTAYRNIYKQPPGVPFGFYYPAQFSGVPQLIIPIGQLPYESTITNHTEYLPLSVTLYAAADCDYVLWDLAAKLEAAGVTSSVATGSVVYPDRV